MEDDKRQPTPLLSVYARSRHYVYPPKVAPFFEIEHSSSFFFLPQSDVVAAKLGGLKVGHDVWANHMWVE